MWDTDHVPKLDDSCVIYRSDDKYKRLVVESSCILRTPNLNGMQSTLGVDNLSQRLIFESHPNILVSLGGVVPGIT